MPLVLNLRLGLGQGSSGPTNISEIPGACSDYDATISDSYSGSGTSWANLIASPADGANQSDYDLTATNGPTFTGTAGDADAYWLLAGDNVSDEHFLLTAASNPPLYRDLHKTSSGNAWWIAFAYADTQTLNEKWWACRNGGSTQGWAVEQSGLKVDFIQGNPTNTKTFMNPTDSTSPAGAVELDNNQWNLLILTGDVDTSTLNWYYNGTKTATTYNTGATTTDAAGKFALGGDPGANQFFGGRIKGWAAGNVFLSDSDAADIKTVYESRYGNIFGTPI